MVFHFMDICGNDCVGHLSRKFEPAGGLFSTTRRVLIWIFSPGRSACWGDFYGAIVRLYQNTEPTVSNPIFPILPYSFMGEIAMLLMPSETTKAAKDQEWAHLISLTAQGDQAALTTFYDRTSPQVFGLVLKILNNREAAEEVTLDVYTQVWRQAHTYDQTRGAPGAWLMTLARTRAIDRFRAGAAEQGRIESLDAAELFVSAGDTPEQDVEGQERRRYVQQALAVLTAEQRQAIALAYFYGLSQSEIAEKLQLPLGTVKTRIRLAMMKLREALAPYESGLTP